MADDERHLRRAIAIAAGAREEGEQPFGSILVAADGVVLAEDRNTVNTTSDITAHPELKLARWAAQHLAPTAARASTMYTSCQPCPMCANVIARSGLGRVVYALSTEQLNGLRPADRVPPNAADVRYDGPALFDQARAAIGDYYA